MPAKSIAVIGAGPAGAITVDALMQEKTFDSVRVFERQDQSGGCWYVRRNGACPLQCNVTPDS